MMNYYDSAIYANTRQQDAKQAADEHRLAQDAAQSESVEIEPKTPIYAPLLARAGDALVELGHQLQNRYGECVDLPTWKEATS